MFPILKRLPGLSYLLPSEDKKLSEAIKLLTGFKPSNIAPYKLALKHVSVAKINFNGSRDSNERLEYLGDAVLGMIVAEHLFKKFPFKDEGFLTEIRSKIVNRESLNLIARKMGIAAILELDNRFAQNGQSHKSVLGDSLEAIIGAVYLDKGYAACQKFVLRKILEPHFDLTLLINSILNYKSVVIEWAQKESKKAQFDIISINQSKHYNEFTAQLSIDDQPISTGFGYSKKKAEQDAAKKSCKVLNLI